MGINFYKSGNADLEIKCKSLIFSIFLFGMLLAKFKSKLNTIVMKKKGKKSDETFVVRELNAHVYHTYDLEMKLVQNINKETPLYSLE